MVKNYFYLIVGILSVLFGVTHTINGLETILPILSNTLLDSSTKTIFTYVWHIIGVENLVLGIALIIMAFQKNVEKVKFAAWVIIAILIMRWVVISFFTTLNDPDNVVNLLPDTIAILISIILLLLGSRVKKQATN